MPNTTQPNRPASTGETKPAKPARRREVYSPEEVAHRWANGADAFDIRGGNLSTRHGSKGAVWLYSYAMPIAVRFLHKRLPHWIVIPAEQAPSRTTGTHLWNAWKAIPDRARAFRAPVLMGGNIGAVSYSYRGTLTPPDADAHKRNLAALLAEAVNRTEQDTRRMQAAFIPADQSVCNRFAEVDTYRATFLSSRKAVSVPPDLMERIREARRNAERRDAEADEKERRRAALDWNFLRPEVERLMRERAPGADRVAALRAAAEAEIAERTAGADDWEGWLNGGARPRALWIPARYDSNSLEEWPALAAFYQATPRDSIFDEAVGGLLRNGTFKRRVRYCFGHETREPYPVKHLREICRGVYPDALEAPSFAHEAMPRWKDTPTLIRLGADGRVETSHGAAVPLAIVRKAWDRFGPIVARAAAGALSDEDGPALAAALPYGLAPYTLTAIDADGVRVGCHLFPPAEIVRFAASQGWPAGI